jgi:hypothetical protein
VCFQEPEELCVAVPCGHPICKECSGRWASHQEVQVSVPGHAPALQAAPVQRPEPPTLPPVVPAPAPWLLPEAVPAPAPWLLPEAAPVPAPRPGVPFVFSGHPVRWEHLDRYGCICLVEDATGELCREGHHNHQPRAPTGFSVWWHRASSRASQKWCLSAVVHEV